MLLIITLNKCAVCQGLLVLTISYNIKSVIMYNLNCAKATQCQFHVYKWGNEGSC